MFGFLTDSVSLPFWVAALLALVPVVMGLVIWSIRRHRDPHLRIECDAPIADLMPSLAGLTQGAVYESNAVELFENGAFFDVMFEEIRGATTSINFETFLWKRARWANGWSRRWSSAGAPACRCASWSTPTVARRWASRRSRSCARAAAS